MSEQPVLTEIDARGVGSLALHLGDRRCDIAHFARTRLKSRDCGEHPILLHDRGCFHQPTVAKIIGHEQHYLRETNGVT